MQAIEAMQKKQKDDVLLDLGALCFASDKEEEKPVLRKDVSQ